MKLYRRQQRTVTGRRVIHRKLDDEKLGTAKVGVVTESVGDDTQELVIAQYEDGSGEEAFDRRELIDLGPAGLSRGPVLIYPHHLWALLKRPLGLAGMLLAFVTGGLIAVLINHVSWSPALVVVVIAPASLAVLILGRLLEQRLGRRRQDS